MLSKPVAILTSKYHRVTGLTQAIRFGTSPQSCDGTPPMKRPIEPAKVRMGFIPDNWFTFFYPKTGVTGPYIFGLGLLNYIFSKEIYICTHEFYNGLSMAILCIVAVKKLGPLAADYCDKEIEKIEQSWKQMHKDELKALENLIAEERQEQWRAEGSLLLMELKRENIALQLEQAHRETMMQVYRDVKHRLDYQVECRNVEMRVNHKHMVNWVVEKVLEAMPKSDDEYVRQKRRADLTALALRIRD